MDQGEKTLCASLHCFKKCLYIWQRHKRELLVAGSEGRKTAKSSLILNTHFNDANIFNDSLAYYVKLSYKMLHEGSCLEFRQNIDKASLIYKEFRFSKPRKQFYKPHEGNKGVQFSHMLHCCAHKISEPLFCPTIKWDHMRKKKRPNTFLLAMWLIVWF